MDITKDDLKQQIIDYHKMIEQHKRNYEEVKKQLLYDLEIAKEKCDRNIERELDDLYYLRKMTEDKYPELWI